MSPAPASLSEEADASGHPSGQLLAILPQIAPLPRVETNALELALATSEAEPYLMPAEDFSAADAPGELRSGVPASPSAATPERAHPSEGPLALGRQPAERGSSGQPIETQPATTAREESARAERLQRAESILEQVRLHLRPDTREAVLQLEPRELGRVAIRLSVRDGRVRASMRAERAETLAVLEAHVPELRALLAQSGLDAHSLELVLGFAPEGRDSGGASHGESDHRPKSPAVAADSIGPRQTVPLALTRALAERLGVDTYA
jgi:flagellar hook-length control protein FliK